MLLGYYIKYKIKTTPEYEKCCHDRTKLCQYFELPTTGKHGEVSYVYSFKHDNNFHINELGTLCLQEDEFKVGEIKNAITKKGSVIIEINTSL